MVRLGFNIKEIKEKAERLRKLVEDFDQKMQNVWWQNFPEEAYRVLDEYEFGPLIATICDERVNAADAWKIPWWLLKKIGNLDPENILKESVKDLLEEYLTKRSLMDEKSRKDWSSRVSKYIEDALKYFIQRNTTPVRMFGNEEYTPAEVYFMLRPVSGIGPKKANMIARDFLYRSRGIANKHPWFDQIVRIYPNFKVVSGEQTLVPIDVHVVKVFNRIFGRRSGDWLREQREHWWDLDIQMFSRLTFPEFPARIDSLLWYVGSNYCKGKNPSCSECPIRSICDSRC